MSKKHQVYMTNTYNGGEVVYPAASLLISGDPENPEKAVLELKFDTAEQREAFIAGTAGTGFRINMVCHP